MKPYSQLSEKEKHILGCFIDAVRNRSIVNLHGLFNRVTDTQLEAILAVASKGFSTYPVDQSKWWDIWKTTAVAGYVLSMNGTLAI